MTDSQLKILQFLALPLAIFFFARWWALPGSLERSTASVVTVSAAYSSYKGGQAVLREQTGETLVVWCNTAPVLCKTLESRSIPSLRIWVLRPTLLRETLLVAAEDGKELLASEAGQNTLLLRTKFMQGGLTLLFVLLAWLFWYFAPFKTTRRRTNAA